MRFERGVYLFTEDEIKKLIEAYEQDRFVEGHKQKYYALYANQKSGEVTSDEEFRRVVLKHRRKKDMIEELGTTVFKFAKYCNTKYGTDNIAVLREKFK